MSLHYEVGESKSGRAANAALQILTKAGNSDVEGVRHRVLIKEAVGASVQA